MEDIHDPTDFKNTSLRQLDLELRCPICKDLYTTPMQLTTCIHSFCALCIRRRLAQERICPICNAPADESKLIRNSVLDGCANTWRSAARQAVIALEQGQANVNNSVEPLQQQQPQQQQQQQQQQRASLPPPPQGVIATPPGPARISSPAGSRRSVRIGSQKQPRYNEPIILDDDDFQQQQQQAQPQPVAPTAPPSQSQLQQPLSPAPQTSSPISVNNITAAAATTPTNDRITQDSEVQCPICSQFMKQGVINEHLDRCMKGDSSIPQPPRQFLRQPAASSSSSASSSPVAAAAPPSTPSAISPTRSRRDQRQNTNRYGKKPIKLVYDMQKDKDLRKVLRDLGLPDHGDKQQLVWRHKEYVTLYYANLDAEHPKESRALIQQLNESELGYNQVRNSAHSPQLNVEEHNRMYKDQFAELIASARKRVRIPSATAASSSSSSSQHANSATEPPPSESSSSLPSTTEDEQTK